jgi:hypothetical protein
MTNPVACAVVFHSVSNARVLSICIVTTPLAMRSSVCAQFAGVLRIFGADGELPGVPAADAVTDDVMDNRKTTLKHAKRDMQIL